ncbi:MAG: hypothetical protein HKM07_03730, partial [Chlamydiae bacterium]|nr:hypothetical protein [Chlamydiota bacterium]
MKEKGFLLTLGLLMSSQICFAMENKLMASQKPPMAPPSTSAIENEREVDRGFVFGEFLYLQPFVDGLEYGFSQKHSVDLSIPTAFVKAKVQDLDFEWSPAFRIGAGYLSPTNWDLSVEWTRLTSHANGSFKTANYPDQFLSAQWLSETVGGQADQARAKWNLNFNTVDLLIGKDFSIGKSFSLHPFIGLRAAWIDQHYKIDYHSQFAFASQNGSGGAL